jgi:hypothetical protein
MTTPLPYPLCIPIPYKSYSSYSGGSATLAVVPKLVAALTWERANRLRNAKAIRDFPLDLEARCEFVRVV